VFLDDVNTTYARIRDRGAELEKERAANPANENGDVEQIQLMAVDPGTTINISIPKKDSAEEDEQKSRTIFETFPPGLQRALEGGNLDEVNVVLGKMSVSEAEEVVGLLSEVCRARFLSPRFTEGSSLLICSQGGMLSIEEQVIDATTEDGQVALKEIEAERKERLKEVEKPETIYEDPE
jgi:cell division cycle protein 37